MRENQIQKKTGKHGGVNNHRHILFVRFSSNDEIIEDKSVDFNGVNRFFIGQFSSIDTIDVIFVEKH